MAATLHIVTADTLLTESSFSQAYDVAFGTVVRFMHFFINHDLPCHFLSKCMME